MSSFMPLLPVRLRTTGFASLQTLLLGCLALFASPAAGQVDLNVHASQIAESGQYGIGGAVLVPISSYSYDIVLDTDYFFKAGDDSLSAFTINLDGHANLFVVRFLRPYTGIGLGYVNVDGKDRVGLNVKGGVYVRLRDWLIPYFQFTYRTIPSFDHSYLQAGFRILLKKQ